MHVLCKDMSMRRATVLVEVQKYFATTTSAANIALPVACLLYFYTSRLVLNELSLSGMTLSEG
eukprot:1066336-Pelagomonas_calceolata.AAC.1